jgi:hypothetical protein
MSPALANIGQQPCPRLDMSKPLPILVHVTQIGRVFHMVGLHGPPYHTPTPPTFLRPSDDAVFFKFPMSVLKFTVYNLWYSTVDEYNIRHLTFPSDKLPAKAGIASRIRATRYHDYLAGHWPRELERSLF